MLEEGNFWLARSAGVFCVETALVVERPMHRQIYLLPHTNLVAWQTHDKHRTVRVRGVVPPRLISIPLRCIKRLPWKWQPQLRRPRKLRSIGDHLPNRVRSPEIVFETRILEYFRPQSPIG